VGSSGIVEFVMPLAGEAISSSGYLIVAKPGFTRGTPDFAGTLASPTHV
jgi:hypothetical protein